LAWNSSTTLESEASEFTVKAWQKASLITLISFAIGGIYLFSVWQHRRDPGVVPESSREPNLTPDDVAVVRMMFPTSFEDALKLQGTSVWMKNGYTMPYYAFAGGRIAFAKRVGLIPSAQRLDIKKAIKATPPAQVDDGISHGSRQVFAVFALPENTSGAPRPDSGTWDSKVLNPSISSPSQYATAIGVIDGSQGSYFSDVLFYYDDPHTIYDNWPKDVWAAIDEHQVKPGMSELQTRMSIGQKSQTDGSSQGNRTVTYNQAGKQWTITYVGNRATTIKSQ
jgi:hypothetical protein